MLRVSAFPFHRATAGLLVTLALATSVLAQNLAPVDWSVTVKGDLLVVDVKTNAGQPDQRMNPSPSYLELAFPKTKPSTPSGTKAIDKGLVQKVQTLQDADTTVLRVYVLSKPKASLSKTSDGYRYTVSINQMADSPPVAVAAPSEPTNTPAPTASAPSPSAPAVKTITPVASTPKEPVKPVATTPTQPKDPVKTAATPTQPVKTTAPTPPKEPIKTVAVSTPKDPVKTAAVTTPTQPAKTAATTASTPPKEPIKTVAVSTPKEPVKSVASTPPTVPSSGPNPKKKINVVFENQPLAQALQMLATQAGYTTQLDPKVSGVVNLSLSEIPFDDALGLLLEPMQSSLSYELRGQTLVVTSKQTTVAASAPTAPSGNSEVVLEYFPFSTKDAQKVADAARKAVPELSYRVDPALNILMVQGPKADVERLEQILKSMSKK